MSTDHYDPKFIQNNPWQTRSREPDQAYIEELAEDIKKNGLLQVPIGRIVDHNGAGAVQLAFGHNRLRAFLHLKRPLMPVDVRELSDEQMAAFAWSENEKRRDVTAVERARAIQKRIEDFGWTNRQAAEALGVDHSTISNILKLLSLPEVLQNANMEGKLSERQMQALLPLFDISDDIYKLLEKHSYYVVNQNRGSIVKSALDGASSDFLREAVDLYLTRTTRDLAQAEFKINHKFQEGSLIYCGLCSNCDRRIASRNRCADLDCYDAKTEAVHQLYLANASIALGYDMVDKEKGGSPTQIWDFEIEKLKALKCPNLRLTYSPGNSREFPGYPHVHLVCDKRNNSCTCIKGLDVMKREMSQHPSRPLSEVMYENFEDSIDVEEPEEKISEGTGEEMEEIDNDEELTGEEGAEAAPEIVASEPRVVTSMELEEAARQQRKAKIELTKKTEEIQAKLEKHMLEEINALSPGAFYVVLHRYSGASERDLVLEKIFKYMASEAARIITNYHSAATVDEMVRLINDQLKRLQLRPFSMQEDAPHPAKVSQDEPAFPEF